MTTQFVQQVSGDGILLPKALLAQWGGHEGQELIVECSDEEIRIVPAEIDPERIADRAATYVLDYVGDAAAVGQPQRIGEVWQVPVVLSYRHKQLGVLTYTLRGRLIADQSDPPDVMRERSREN